MPLYEYVCDDCQARFEVLRSMGQSSLAVACPRCHGANARKMISAFAAISKDSAGGSRMVASSSAGCNCGGCSGGSCSSCGH
ncbi:MAG TPA: zinc ribbon domain-containing protein [Anaerolineae bacterium]